VADGFIDGLNQHEGPRRLLFQNLPVRLKSGDCFEFSLAQDFADALQLEAQLAVKEDLLEHKQLRLFVDPVAVRSCVGGLQQRDFIVKMKRAHGDARHQGQLLDGVSHRFLPRALFHLPGSRKVRVKPKVENLKQLPASPASGWRRSFNSAPCAGQLCVHFVLRIMGEWSATRKLSSDQAVKSRLVGLPDMCPTTLAGDFTSPVSALIGTSRVALGSDVLYFTPCVRYRAVPRANRIQPTVKALNQSGFKDDGAQNWAQSQKPRVRQLAN
jgi:hypothetical protein